MSEYKMNMNQNIDDFDRILNNARERKESTFDKETIFSSFNNPPQI